MPKPKPKALPIVRQCHIDPRRFLPRDLRRAATSILNDLRLPNPRPLKLPIEQAHVVAIALAAARVQELRVPREVVYE